MKLANYEESENSPSFADDELGIKIRFAGKGTKTVLNADDPWPVFGAYQAGKETIREFGDDIDRHIIVVVFHKETRAIFSGGVLDYDPVEPSHAQPREDSDFDVLTTMSYFNIDLKRQCRIDPAPGKYWVIVFVGKLSSQVLEFEVK